MPPWERRRLAVVGSVSVTKMPPWERRRLAVVGLASVLMKVLARACGHRSLAGFCLDDLTTFDRNLALLTGLP